METGFPKLTISGKGKFLSKKPDEPKPHELTSANIHDFCIRLDNEDDEGLYSIPDRTTTK